MTRIRFRYAVGEALKYLSHLDLMRLFHRALRRSGLPMAYSQGFSPHPRLGLAVPLPVGATAAREYGDIFFSEPVTPEFFLKAVRAQLPPGLSLIGAHQADQAEPSLAAVINAACYEACWAGTAPGPAEEVLEQAAAQLLRRGEIPVQRQSRDGQMVTADIRPYIHEAFFFRDEAGKAGVSLLLQQGSRGGVSPFLVLQQLGLAEEYQQMHFWRLHRRALYVYDGKRPSTPFWEGGEN